MSDLFIFSPDNRTPAPLAGGRGGTIGGVIAGIAALTLFTAKCNP